jgi:hypothetical protein
LWSRFDVFLLCYEIVIALINCVHRKLYDIAKGPTYQNLVFTLGVNITYNFILKIWTFYYILFLHMDGLDPRTCTFVCIHLQILAQVCTLSNETIELLKICNKVWSWKYWSQSQIYNGSTENFHTGCHMAIKFCKLACIIHGTAPFFLFFYNQWNVEAGCWTPILNITLNQNKTS